MRPFIQKLPLSENSSFMAGEFKTPYFETAWHYHQTEFELVFIRRGTGRKFIGDHISDFEPGTLTLLAPELPHLFRKHDRDSVAENYVIHFEENFLGEGFFKKPEMEKVSQLLEKSKRGIDFQGSVIDKVKRLLDTLFVKEGLDRLLLLLEILNELSGHENYKLLSSPGVIGKDARDTEIINKIFDFTFENFQGNIRLEEVAGIANMSESAFSKYFKKRTRKNYSVFLNEIRVGYACKLLIEGNHNVTAVCFESGFQNMTNFLKQFKKQTGKTPLKYQKEYVHGNLNVS